MDPVSIATLLGGSALAGGLSGATAKSGRWDKLSSLTPQQVGRAETAGQLGLSQIQNPYQGFEPIAKRAQSMFQQQTLPSIAERFTSLGSGSALSSPAFASQVGSAGADLSETLAALMSEYGLRQQGLGQNLLGMGQSPQFENVYTAGGPSFLSNLFGGMSGGLGALGGAGIMKRFGGYGNQEDNSGILKQILELLKRRQ